LVICGGGNSRNRTPTQDLELGDQHEKGEKINILLIVIIMVTFSTPVFVVTTLSYKRK